MELLKILSETPAAPGREERLRQYLLERLTPSADRVEVDILGNLICHKAATHASGKPAKKVMVACHMDEIAFYVRHIDEQGFLRLKELGGFDPHNLYARQVLIQGKRDLHGVMNPGIPPIHVADAEDKKRVPKISDFFVDTGLPAEEVKSLIRPGDPVTLVQSFRTMGKTATGKCMDNRAACWVGARLIERLQKTRYDVAVAFTVQEEVGIRGVRTAAHHLEPDIGIAIDVTLALDHPGMPKEEVITELGRGVAIKVMDGASISDRGLVDEMLQLAESGNIPHQLELLPRGGTDAAGIQLSRHGVKVITLSVPCRYIHTITETLHQDDLEACLNLLMRFLSP